MKKLMLILSIVFTFVLSSCDNKTIVYVDKYYENYDNLSLNELYNENKKSSVAIKVNSTDLYSGTIIDEDDKYFYIVTYYFYSLVYVEVYIDNDIYVSGVEIGSDGSNELALVRISKFDVSNNGVTLNVASKRIDNIKKGEKVFNISTHTSLVNYNSLTVGYISNITDLYLMSDCALNPSSYGSGLYDISGKLCGIFIKKTYAVVDEANSYSVLNKYYQGLSYSYDIEFVSKIYLDMRKNGNISRPLLNISIEAYSSASNSEKYNTPDTNMYYIVSEAKRIDLFTPNQIHTGDILCEANGKKVTSIYTLRKEVLSSLVGDKLLLTVIRYNADKTYSEVTLNITLK